MSNEISELPNVVNTDTGALVLAPDSMNNIIEFAKFMASAGPMLPKHLQGQPADCMAITLQAMQWGMSPFAVAQKTHLVNGTLGYESQLVNAVVSSSRAVEGRFHYQYGGDWDNGAADRCVRVGAILRGENEIQWGEPLYPAKVTTKNSPLWKTAEKQQAGYLALKYWARLYCPAVMLGVYTSDELQDMEPRDVTPQAKTLDIAELQSVSAGNDDSDLKEALAAIEAATDKAGLDAAAEMAKGLSADDQKKARPAYQKKAAELKPKNSEAFEAISNLVDMANSENDLEAVVNMPQWSELGNGEAAQLQNAIAGVRASFTDSGAAGAFGG